MGSKLSRYINLEKVLNYIEKRRHEDGGYCFVSQLDDTNINDTYYAVKIYSLLGIEVPEKEKTIEFLYSSAKPQAATVAIAMAVEALSILGAKNLAEEKMNLLFKKYNPMEDKFAVGLGGSEEFGTATPLEATYWVMRAMKAVNYNPSNEMRKGIIEFVHKFKLGDAYGVTHPTTTMTYQALYTLDFLGIREDTRHFELCEVCGDWGGFTEVPNSLPPYIEPTFYALRGLELLGRKAKCIEAHIKFIRSLQNQNGGFRRSYELGISNFQNTYRALASLDILLRWL
ncbi:hypothetical protein PFDSM3638_07100 [Pyrococcus furiosus DSM 3638]|uniref:Prenyltransferase alpha-alpha toroid domain-containing protein n=3 Tax=Pyrococcus furiosus TaxID=2261 RepID=A0A5C0XS26_PYRFU|nr:MULTISPECIES: prenyltransferase/squalene oxidase repeat-containing protein [Pyrococcus]AAL81542.1 hypothetical protein PF1418 [Pyrococcus furiosus DSM 3638]AFN04199.1 hypothetical protein PFC_06315 [Pyrococcus furiosus COM1]MDK2870506.1 uncharacterized protein [Pyrococcus sp.]QEK79048.1 hypothetical protein PFDSM3638_07100 [Pyrococcus furiosus DSM 3638]